jgi:hypothetical protein
MEMRYQLHATATLPYDEDPSVLIAEGAICVRASLNEMTIGYLYFRKGKKIQVKLPLCLIKHYAMKP